MTQLLDAVPEAEADEATPDVKIIEDLATLRLLSDPLRLRLIEELGAAPTTVKALARAMDMKPNRLYYHVNLLEEHGLVRVTQTRIVSGIVERTYALVAKHFAVSDALPLPVDLKREVTNNLFQVVSAELDEAVDTNVGRVQLWLTNDEREAFKRELGDLLDKYGNGDRHRVDVDADRYTLLFALYAPVDHPKRKK
ncbi:MAG TPA: helix-turn-helix domain-containing protein [Acidimicrobiales bacterium]|nr:helix-turn-helix domain-containing protein [Acidimicrobiales bacterium]